MNKTDAKFAIENMEYLKSGLDHISGSGVKVVNLRSSKDHWHYDLIEYKVDYKGRYYNCTMPKSAVEKYLEKEAK